MGIEVTKKAYIDLVKAKKVIIKDEPDRDYEYLTEWNMATVQYMCLLGPEGQSRSFYIYRPIIKES
jgi:hypothetical protein